MPGEDVIHHERELLAKLKAGNYMAFEVIYHRYKVRLASRVLRLVKSQELADDILQELFVRLWEHRATIDPEQPIKAYLFRIAENLVYDLFRRLSKERKLQDHIFQTMASFTVGVEEQVFATEERRLVEAAIAMLPPKRREVFVLCKMESKSYEEVSKQLNISLSTINDHIYKANQFLRQHLANQAISLLMITLPTTIASAI